MAATPGKEKVTQPQLRNDPTPQAGKEAQKRQNRPDSERGQSESPDDPRQYRPRESDPGSIE